MKILAFELSARRRSVALLDEGRPAGDVLWEEDLSATREARGRREALFGRVSALLEQGRLAIEALDMYAVGRGPGAYSGMRVAMAAARGLALPDGKPVHAVSSGAALACEVLSETSGAVAVLGDARRDALWLGVFEGEADRPRQTMEWRLAAWDEADRLVPERALLVTPDWDRLKERIPSSPLRGRHWIEEARYPTAAAVGLLAGRRQAAGVPSEPLTPLYLHPAVAGSARP